MKNIPCKDGFIYSSMKKHYIKLLCYIVFLFLVLVTYYFGFKPYISNVFFGSVPLDETRFSDDAQMINISSGIETNRNDNLIIKNYSLKTTSYWQDDKYEFDVVLSDVKKTGITYTTRNTSDTFEEGSDEYLSAILYSAEINGIHTLILAYPHQEITNGSTVTGIFTEFPLVVKADLSSYGTYEDKECFMYMLDTRGVEMESESFDVLFVLVLGLIVLYLLIKFIIYSINPYFTPTYRALDKYGDINSVVEDIEAQLKEAGVTRIKGRKSIYTKDWIVSEDTFKLKVAKNHAKPQDNSRYGSKF